jgi:hypothetical protein
LASLPCASKGQLLAMADPKVKAAVAQAEKNGKKPNIVVIMGDEQGLNDRNPLLTASIASSRDSGQTFRRPAGQLPALVLAASGQQWAALGSSALRASRVGLRPKQSPSARERTGRRRSVRGHQTFMGSETVPSFGADASNV